MSQTGAAGSEDQYSALNDEHCKGSRRREARPHAALLHKVSAKWQSLGRRLHAGGLGVAAQFSDSIIDLRTLLGRCN
jgi:hypothetical protein